MLSCLALLLQDKIYFNLKNFQIVRIQYLKSHSLYYGLVVAMVLCLCVNYVLCVNFKM